MEKCIYHGDKNCKCRYKVYYIAQQVGEHTETVYLVQMIEARQRGSPGEKGVGVSPSEEVSSKKAVMSSTGVQLRLDPGIPSGGRRWRKG